MDKLELIKFTANRSIEEAEELYQQRIKDAEAIYAKHHQNFVARDCPVCGSDDYKDLEAFHNTYKVVKCSICAMVFINPTPNEEALDDFYKNSKCNSLLDEIYKERAKKKTYILDDRIKIVLEHLGKLDPSEKIKIIEIGCGSGAFLSKLKTGIGTRLKNYTIEFHGIDIDSNIVSQSVDKELKLICDSAENFIKHDLEKYDIILHFELIEHLVDPYTFMVGIGKLLKKDGICIFTTPNADGLEMLAADYNAKRLLAHGIFPPMHLNAFSVFSMTHFAIRSGFKVIDISTPGKLDVDMVSILKNELNDDGFKALAEMDDRTKGVIQYLIAMLKVSSHMRCIVGKNNLG